MSEGTDNERPEVTGAAALPIVAIGASAGGLEALRQLFSGLPPDTGMAFVVIQHLDPGHPSMLSNVLAADVAMQVFEVAEGTRAAPNTVYVIPPGADLSIHDGQLSLIPRQQTRNLHLPIDSFFRELAADCSVRAIGVVLSGSGSDGTEGLRAIKAAGGITFAQDPQSAQFPSMPESAMAAGVVDFRSPPDEICRELVRLSHHVYLRLSDAPGPSPEEIAPDDEACLTRILSSVRQHAQLDFRGYKRATILRRIARRMALRRVGALSEYAEAVGQDPTESKALAQDILIHVTSFFRDPAVFAALSQQVLPELLKHKGEDATVRVWVPGCATGEEAFSIGICLAEYLEEHRRNLSVTIFGSDVSERAIGIARAAVYNESDLGGVSPERLARYFDRADGRYRIGKRVRDMCVFVRHDLTRDPPFARLDLISCRNVLIYFDADLQRRVVPLMHHCLNTPGYLLLGSSEGGREYDDLFLPIEKECRIFLKTGEGRRIDFPRPLGYEAESKLASFQPAQRQQPARDAQRQADHILLARYSPPGVVVDERLEVVQFRGHTGDFLEAPPGLPQTNVLRLAREGLVGPLRELLEAASTQSTGGRKLVRIDRQGQPHRTVNLEVLPIAGVAAQRYYLIIFEEADRGGAAQVSTPALSVAGPAPDSQEEVARLRAELSATRDYLQGILGERQDVGEELGAANEELIAANEELQSANEELQSAKEELQSTNEELITLNDELHSRNQELDQAANDLINVLESVQIPVIIVDQTLRIRRFTPSSREVASILPGDVGRPIDDLKLKLHIDDLAARIRQTVESVTPKEFDVQALDGRWFKLNIRPYLRTDNRLDGALLSFLDIDVLKRTLQEAERARDYAQRIVETVPLSLVVLDDALRIVSANPPFYRSFATPPRTALFELAGGALDVPELRKAAESSLASGIPFQDVEVKCDLPVRGRRELVIAGCPIQDSSGGPLLLLAIEDITERRLLEASEKQSRLEAEQANRAKDLFQATLSHELRTPLSTILTSAQLLQMLATEDPRIRRASAAIERAAGNQAGLINDLLDISRIVSGKLTLNLQPVDLTTVVQSAVDVAQPAAEAKGVALLVEMNGPVRPIHGDPARLQQVVANLLNNSIKFTPPGGKIGVRLEVMDSKVVLTVTDTGFGFPPDLIPHLFQRFVQAESSMTRAQGGLGLGLAIVRHIVTVHGGEVRAESPGEGRGATFTVSLPLAADDAPRETRKPTVSRSIHGVRVLLVEDDDDTRESCASMLAEQGADVRAARSVAEGLAALGSFSPQAILCDIAMPGEDGFAFVRKLRKVDNPGREIPAAALTALAGEDDRRRALAAGFQMHLAKPIDSDRLASAIATLVNAPQKSSG